MDVAATDDSGPSEVADPDVAGWAVVGSEVAGLDKELLDCRATSGRSGDEQDARDMTASMATGLSTPTLNRLLMLALGYPIAGVT